VYTIRWPRCLPKAPRSFALPLDARLPARPGHRAPQQATTQASGLIQWAGVIAATIGLFLLLGSVATGLLGFNSAICGV
jgi:hypothetical protein